MYSSINRLLYLQGVKNGEQVVEGNAGQVDGKDGEDPGEAKQDDHTHRSTQALDRGEGVGLGQSSLGHTHQLPDDEGKGREVDGHDDTHGGHEGHMEGDTLEPATVTHTHTALCQP